METYAIRIKEMCKTRGVTVKELSSKIDMTEAGFHKSLNHNKLKVEKLLQISNELDISVAYLVGETDMKQTAKKAFMPLLMNEPESEYTSSMSLEQRVLMLENFVKTCSAAASNITSR